LSESDYQIIVVTMANTFFSKKQKAQWRERQKKKKSAPLKEQSGDHATEPDSKRPLDEEVMLNGDSDQISKKRPRGEEEEESPEDSNKKQRSLDFKTKVINGKLYVIVPTTLSTKNAKKFRKEARRQLREEGNDESNMEFVAADEVPHQPKKKKKIFPSIKELLQEKKQAEVTRKEEEKKDKKMSKIPDDVKAQYLALDCEMVGIGTDGKKSALARVSIVDWDMNVILDSFVKVPIRVTDFRTHVSGVEPKHIKNANAMDETKCRDLVASLLKGKVLVGHALTNDLKALMLTHPKHNLRDTAKHRPFQRFANGKWRARKLRDLVKENLKGREGFQVAEHDSVQDAQATMEIFQLVQSGWEKEIASKTK
jgi:RNA exonuclease 4